MTIREAMHIDCPPAAAFDMMADVRRVADWNGGVSRAEMTSAGPIGQGSKFIAINRGQKLESTITTFDRPELLEFSTAGKAFDVAGTFRFEEAGAGTGLVIELDPHPKGIMKLLFPVLKPMIRRDLRKQHLKFKDYCESQQRPHEA